MYKDHVNFKKKNWFGKKYNHFGKTENSECVQFFCKLFYYNLRHCSINKVAKHRDCQWPTVVLQICTSILGCMHISFYLIFITCSSSRLFLGHCPCNNINFYSFYRSRQQLHPPPFKIIHKGLILKIVGIWEPERERERDPCDLYYYRILPM